MQIDKSAARLAAAIYFVQGALGVANIAFPLYLRAAGFEIKEIALISGLAVTPWFFKIFYGAISDAFPIGGLRRKPYLMLCSLISIVGCALVAIVPAQMAWVIFAMGVSHLGTAAGDVIADGYVVDHSDETTAQTYQTISWGSRSVGALLSGITGGILAATLSPRTVFAITAFLPLITLWAAFTLKEGPRPKRAEGEGVFHLLWRSLKLLVKGEIFWFALLLLMGSATATFATPLFFYLKEQLMFDEVFLGLLSSTTWAGTIIGCFVYMRFFRKVSIQKTLFFAIIIGFFETLSLFLLRDRTSAWLLFLLSGVLGYMSLLPFMSAAAKLCHGTGVESSLFAILMSVFNAGKQTAGIAGGYLFQWTGLWPLVAGAAVFGLFPLLIVPKLKSLR